MEKPKTQLASARITTPLFKSDFYEIKNWTLNSDHRTQFEKEYNDCFCAVHMHHGTLTKKMYQLSTGNVTLEQPDFEYQLLPSNGSCTIINFTEEFYAYAKEEFRIDTVFSKQRKMSLTVKASATPESEFVLHTLLNSVHLAENIHIDVLVVDYLKELLHTNWSSSIPASALLQPYKKHHQDVIANAKHFLQTNFSKNISLSDLSRHCGVSLFHLSHLFKQHTTYSPHQYLSRIRLKHGQMLLRDTTLPVVDISYATGFSSPEYFSTLFRLKYNQSPTSYRKYKK